MGEPEMVRNGFAKNLQVQQCDPIRMEALGAIWRVSSHGSRVCQGFSISGLSHPLKIQLCDICVTSFQNSLILHQL